MHGYCAAAIPLAKKVCKAMTMYYGLNSEDSIEDLFYSNSNRSKPWKQYRDQIVRLGPACDAAKKVDDIGLTTDKVAQKAKLSQASMQQSSSSSSSGSHNNVNEDGDDDDASEGDAAAQAETRDRLALATRFLESEDLFTDAERFLILEKCGLVASCLWAEVTATFPPRSLFLFFKAACFTPRTVHSS